MTDLAPAVAGYSAAETADFAFSGGQNAAVPERTAGQLLRDAREAAGLHIGALAVSLKIPVKKLEALEQDRFDLLLDAVFARALASSVCRTLKIDASQVLERLPPSNATRLNYHGAGINTPFNSSGAGTRLSLWTQVSRPAVIACLAFLLGALVLIFLPDMRPDAVSGKVDAAGVSTAVDRVKSPTEGAAGTGTTGLFTSATELNAPTSAAVSGPLPIPGNSTTALSVPAQAMPAAVQSASADLVTFRAKGESWVEVTDAKGAVVLRRTLAAGDVVGASGKLPLAAVVGRADATQVQVRGQELDLTEIARNNVVHFEVK